MTKLTVDIDPEKMQYLAEKMEIEKGMNLINAKDNPKQLKNLVDLYLVRSWLFSISST